MSFLKTTNLWPWVFPVTYLLHIVEESCGGGGYSAYLERLRGIQLTPAKFLVAQGIGLILMVVGVVLARQLRFSNLFNVVLGSVVLVNSLTHTFQPVAHGEYVPGLVTAILIWLPLGIATLVRFKDAMSRQRYWLAVALGVGINVVVELMIVGSG